MGHPFRPVTAIAISALAVYGSALDQAALANPIPAVTPDVGAGGTIGVAVFTTGGFVVLDERSPIDVRRPIRYFGGSILP